MPDDRSPVNMVKCQCEHLSHAIQARDAGCGCQAVAVQNVATAYGSYALCQHCVDELHMQLPPSGPRPQSAVAQMAKTAVLRHRIKLHLITIGVPPPTAESASIAILALVDAHYNPPLEKLKPGELDARD